MTISPSPYEMHSLLNNEIIPAFFAYRCMDLLSAFRLTQHAIIIGSYEIKNECIDL